MLFSDNRISFGDIKLLNERLESFIASARSSCYNRREQRITSRRWMFMRVDTRTIGACACTVADESRFVK